MRFMFTSVLLLVAVQIGARGESFQFTEGGKAHCYLDVRSPLEGNGKAALEDFQSILTRITGAPLSTESDSGLSRLVLAVAESQPDVPFSLPQLEREGFLFKVTPDTIYLIGADQDGLSHALYTLLRDIGCRWIMSGDIGECLPSGANLTLPLGERVEAPDFRYREIWYAYGSSPEGAERRLLWTHRNRMARPSIMHGHNLTSTLARKATFEQRPDLYGMLNGKRATQQICTSNPETVQLVTESIQDYMKSNPEMEGYSLCPDDNHDFCECESCRALDTGHMDRGGKPSISDRYQVFMNQVLKGLAETNPELLLTTYSYNVNHTDPPQKTPVDPRTAIFATSSAFCAAHGVGDEFCSSRQDFRKLLAEWTALTPHIYIYEYDPVPYSGGLPWPMWSSHIREMKVYRDLGVKGVSFEGQNSWAAYFPNYYVASQMMWDVDQDGEAVFDDMLQHFFGEAAPAMKEYYASLESVIGGVSKKVEWGLSMYPGLFPAEVEESAVKALAQAGAVKVSPIIRKRIEMVQLSQQEMTGYLTVRRSNNEITFAEYQKKLDGLDQAIDTMEATNEDYLLAKIAREKTGNAVGEQFAPELGFANRWMLIGPFPNRGLSGHDEAFPPEREISLDAEFKGLADGVVKWAANSTPEWRAYVDLLNEFKETENVCAYALCWVTLKDGPCDAEFRVGSNDSVKVFVGGKEVWSNPTQRPASVDQDRFNVTLQAGPTPILIKICQTGLNWGFYFRIMEPGQDRPLAGLRYSTSPPR